MNDNDRSSISAMGKCFIPSRYLSQHPEYFKIGSLVLLSRSSSLDDHDHDRGVGVSLELAKEPPAQICLCVVWPVAENPQMKNSLEHQEENLDEERLASVWYDGSITLNQSSCCSSSQWSQSLPLRVKGLNNQDRGGDTCGSSRSNLMMSKPHALSVYAVVPERIQLSVLWLTEIIIEQHEPLAALDLDLEEEEEEEEEESSPTRPLKPLFVHQRLKAALVRKYISLGSTIRTTTLTNGRRRRRMDDDSQHKRECREYHVTQISPEGTRSTRLFPTFYYIGPDTTIMISSSSSVAKEEEEDQPLPKTTLHKTSKPGKMMIAGYRHERSEIQDFITASVEYQDILRAFPALRLPRGLLIYGPSGVGKTQLIREICNELRVSSSSPRVSVTWTSASSVRSAPCPEAALVALFRGTTKTRVVVGTRSRSSPPPIRILVIDQLQLLCARRESSHSGSDENQSQTRIVAQLLTLLDGLMMMSPVQVIGICGESLETFDPALRRTGRFDRELEIKLPDVLTRREILARYHYLAPTTTTGPGGDSTHVAPTTERPPPQVNLLDQVARVSTGYSGSDLMSLCREARLIWLDRRRNQLLCHHRLFYRHWYVLFPLVIRSCLFQSFTRSLEEDHHHSAPPGLREYLLAMANTGASVLRSTASSSSASSSASSKVTWKDIGGHEEAKRVFQKSIEWPVAYAATFARLNLQPLSGILLYGPPGNSKTTFVKAAAEASGASFFSLCPADLYSPYFVRVFCHHLLTNKLTSSRTHISIGRSRGDDSKNLSTCSTCFASDCVFRRTRYTGDETRKWWRRGRVFFANGAPDSVYVTQ